MTIKRFTVTMSPENKVVFIITDEKKKVKIPEGYTKCGRSFYGDLDKVSDKSVCIFQ